MKLFVFSDCHGFADNLIKELDKAGFDKNNPNHLLIGCGDYFDRGQKPYEVMMYLKEIQNKVLCKGNHELLLLECLNRGEAYGYDITNGTAETIAILGERMETRWVPVFHECFEVIEKPMQKWVGDMVNYFETQNYIFCHGFIPCNDNRRKPWYQNGITFTKRDDWRNASNKEWEDAMWINGIKACGVDGVYEEGKTIVVGHYHTSWGHHNFEGKDEFGTEADFSPFYYNDKLIAIDACTAYSGKVNVLVLEDELIK